MKMLVTGGAGFIGSNFARYVLEEHPEDDGRRARQADLRGPRGDHPGPDRRRPLPVRARATSPTRTSCARRSTGCDAVVNFAAESHVDRSIEEPGHFIQTDVYGTYVLLEEARRAGIERYLQVSTDEVYGSIEDGTFTEQSPLAPSSPYSASKAGGDLLVSAYCHTYGMNATVCRASNNYGPYQYPEKLIPLCVLNAMHGDPLPVYGDGMQVRNWLYVTDHCRGHRRRAARRQRRRDLQHRRPGRASEHRRRPHDRRADGRGRVADPVRQGPSRARPPLLARRRRRRRRWDGRPQVPFTEGIAATVDWYRDNDWWWEPIRSGDYREYYQRQYGQELRLLRFQRLDTRIDGLVLVQPKVITRRPRLLLRDVPPQRVRGPRDRCRVRAGQPLALGARHDPRASLPAHARPGEADPRRARIDLRRRGRPAAATPPRTGSSRRSS